MTQETQDDLMILRQCLEESLEEDFVKITFKDTTKQYVIITRIKEIAGQRDIEILTDDSISAFDVATAEWLDINLKDIDVAESVAVFQEFTEVDARLE